MKHKTILSIEEKNKKIEFLRKQCKGAIIGDYRNILASIYEKIKTISKSNDGICHIILLQKECLASTKHKENVLFDYCLDLEQLGYIQIDDDTQIRIIKELDF